MYVNKKAKKVRFSQRSIIFLITVFIVVTVLIIGLIMILTSGREVEDTLTPLPFKSTDSYFSDGKNIFYSEGDLLTCIDSSLNEQKKLRLFSDNLKYTANSSIIAATSDTVLQVIDVNGNYLLTSDYEGKIDSVRLAKDKIAVYINETKGDAERSYIFILDTKGNDLYSIDISGRTVLDYGFDSYSELLYVLELDVTGAAPISRITTYRPETQSITSIKELKDQLISKVMIIDGAVYAMGTNQLTMYQSLNADEREIMIYGWSLEDVNLQDNPNFVYVPNSDKKKYFDAVRIIKTSGNETKINLPPEVFSVMHMGEKIYCFATNKFFVYTSEGEYLRTHELPFDIDKVKRVNDKYVLINVGETVYLLPLP